MAIFVSHDQIAKLTSPPFKANNIFHFFYRQFIYVSLSLFYGNDDGILGFVHIVFILFGDDMPAENHDGKYKYLCLYIDYIYTKITKIIL